MLLFFVVNSSYGQQSAEKAIRQVLSDQETAWNKGDIDAFMKGYWNSDSLLFIGTNGITYGFNNTLKRYKSSYNSPEKMGRLKFDLLQFIQLGKECFMIVGKWQLTRTIGDTGGHFSLLFKRIKERWLIISDHTS